MPISVRGPDGTIYRVNTEDENVARETVRRRLSRNGGKESKERGAPEATLEQRTQAAQRAANRSMIRNSVPGMGIVAQPFADLISDPDRRAAAGRSFRSAMRDMGELPRLDWGQVARDTGNSIAQGVQNLPQTVGNIATHIPELARGLTYGPFADEEKAQQALDLARIQGDQPGVERAADQANTATRDAGVNIAGAGFGSVVRTPLQAAALGATLTAPSAFDGAGDLQQRVPQGLSRMTGSALTGAGIQGALNALPRIARAMPARGAGMVQRMDRAGASVDAAGNPQTPRGVTPSLATANEGVGVSGAATKLVGDNIVAGPAVRSRVRRALTETRDAAHDIAAGYGRARTPEGAGGLIQRALQRFSRDKTLPNPQPGVHPRNVPTQDWSFASKADALYDLALRPVESNPAALTNTQSALSRIAQQADDPAVRAFQADSTLRQFTETMRKIQRAGRTPTLRDLRELRRKVRLAREGMDGVDNASLASIEGALTEDIYAAAGPVADDLRRVDAFYRRGRRRIDGTLRAFDPNNVDPRQSITNILRAANPKTANTPALAALRSSLRDDEWRIVAASIIEHMGKPTAGAAGFVAQQDFSVAQFASAYRNMTPGARRILFGSRGGAGGQSGRTMRVLADDLDNLAQVALAQKGVENSANFSGSGRDANNFATFGIAAGNLPVAAGTVAGLAITGEMLTNPGFVRWLVSAQKRGGGAAGMRHQLGGLVRLAGRDPALWPLVEQLQAQQSEPAPVAGGDPASTPPQRELALQ